jgi:hypothetical protein
MDSGTIRDGNSTVHVPYMLRQFNVQQPAISLETYECMCDVSDSVGRNADHVLRPTDLRRLNISLIGSYELNF